MKEALSILRQAFKATAEDNNYIADSQKCKLTVDHISGEQIELFVETNLFGDSGRKRAPQFQGQKK